MRQAMLDGGIVLDANRPKANSFKAQLIRAMKLMYPEGVSSTEQHRDVIRLYAVGWGDGLMINGKNDELVKHRADMMVVADPDWWPDHSWVWWS